MAHSVDDLGPVYIPSSTVTVEIGASSGETGEPATGDGLVHYQGASPFYPDAQPFELAYSPSVWDYVPGDEPNHADHLRHHEMAHCSLWLGGGGSRATPVSTANLADHEWTISQVRPDFLDYSTRRDRGVLAFGLRLPERYKADVKGPCQELAEDVLGTIEVPGRPLPPSMKGYELYSWYEEDAAWYFTLITGSNRLKTLEEIRARTNVVGPDGWASILVRGTGPLKTLLRRLPSGEQVTWIGAEWLKQVGADEEMVGTMRLPDPATVAEIEAFCRELGVSMHVAAAPDLTCQAEPTDDELALQSLMDFFGHLSAGRYEEAGQLYGGSYEVLSEYNPTLDPHDHAAMWQAACTSNGFLCLRVRSAHLQEDGSAKAEYRFLVEFSTPDDQLFVRGPCCGASETEMPPESEFLFAVVRTEDGAYRVQDLPVYIP
jgi:hypothetical protein